MSIQCAGCNREFKGLYAIFMIWEKQKEVYLCGRCGEGVEGLDRAFHPGLFLWGSLLVSSIVLLLMSASIMDHHIRKEWSELEMTALGELEEGETMKLEGFIAEDRNTVVLDGHYTKAGRSSTWVWDETSFSVSNNGSLVNVTTGNYYVIHPGEHDKAYRGGDSVVIVGEVQTRGGETIVEIRWMGQSEENLKPALWPLLSFFGVVVLINLLFVVDAWQKKKGHNRNAASTHPVQTLESREQETSSITWMVNRRIAARYYVTSFGFIGLLALTSWLGAGSQDSMTRDGLIAGMVGAPLLVGALVGLPLIVLTPSFFLSHPAMPEEIGYSRRGVHFHTRHPLYTGPAFLLWNEITKQDLVRGRRGENLAGLMELGFEPSSKPKETTRAGLDFMTSMDNPDPFRFLTEKNRKILQEWWTNMRDAQDLQT